MKITESLKVFHIFAILALLIGFKRVNFRKKPFVFIAVGGNMTVLEESIKVRKDLVKIHKCNWLSILMTINKYEKELDSISVPDMNYSSTRRLLDNIILAFNINGVYNIDWFNTMARKAPIINTSSIDNLHSLYKW